MIQYLNYKRNVKADALDLIKIYFTGKLKIHGFRFGQNVDEINHHYTLQAAILIKMIFI